MHWDTPWSLKRLFKRFKDSTGKGELRLIPQKQRLDDDDFSDKAVISDDTQMTLFTANGLLNAKRLKVNPKYAICMAYIEWYLTQIGKWSNKFKDCWIARIPELNKRRAPGNTCMSSQDDIYRGKDPMNNSKGCGGQGDWYDATRDVESDVSIIQVLFLLLPLILLFYPWIRLFMSMIRNHISTAYFGLFCAMNIVSKITSVILTILNIFTIIWLTWNLSNEADRINSWDYAHGLCPSYEDVYIGYILQIIAFWGSVHLAYSIYHRISLKKQIAS